MIKIINRIISLIFSNFYFDLFVFIVFITIGLLFFLVFLNDYNSAKQINEDGAGMIIAAFGLLLAGLLGLYSTIYYEKIRREHNKGVLEDGQEQLLFKYKLILYDEDDEEKQPWEY